VTKIGFRRGTFLRGFMFDFIEKFAPHLTKDIINEAFNRHSRMELDELFENIKIPTY
jgi:LysR family cys regulon transcriptional activator